MTTNRTVGDKEIIMGTVVARYLPGIKMSKSGNEYLASGKLVLESEDGVYEVSFMQLYVDNVRTEEMGALWTSLDLDAIQGKQVAIACTFESDYINSTTGAVKHQFKNPTFIKYLNPGDEPPPKPTQEQVATAPAPVDSPQGFQQSFSLDERIAWNSAINNIMLSDKGPRILFSFSEERYRGYADDGKRIEGEGSAYLDEFFSEVGRVAYSLYKVIRRGPVEPVVKPMELTPEQELFPQQELFQGLTGEV